MDMRDVNRALELIGKMDMPQALAVVHMFMEKIEADGGVAAVGKDLKVNYPDLDISTDAVKHAMTCGGAIVLITMGMALKLQRTSDPDLKSSPEPENMEAQREAQAAIERARKLH
jgi:hypothetical protein